MSTRQHLMWYINCIIFYVLDIPLYCYCCLIVYRHREDMYFYRRHMFLSLTLIGGFVFMGFRASGLYMPLFTIEDGLIDQTWFGITVSIDWFEVMTVFALYIAIFTVALRGWHLWFDLNWGQQIANQKWTSTVNNDKTKKSFFLRKRKTLGSVKYTSKLFTIYFIINILHSMILIGILGDNPTLFTASWNIFYLHLTISIFLPFYFLYKAPYDTLGIKSELIIFQISWFFLCSFFTYTGITHVHLIHQWWFNIHSFLTTMVPVIFMFVGVFYPMYRVKKNYAFLETDERMIRQNSHAHETSSTTGSSSKLDSFAANLPNSWKEYVTNEHNINVLMRYLIKEFCIESLTFVLECCQLKKYHFDKGTCTNDQNEKIKDINEMGFYVNFDLKNIVQTDVIKDNNTLKQQLKLLYNKYIIEGCDLEINISYEQHQTLDTFFKNHESDEENPNDNLLGAIQIFDDGLVEVSRLLRSCYVRLKLYVHLQPQFVDETVVSIQMTDQNNEK
eukprot:169463_1